MAGRRIRYCDTLLASKGEKKKVYSISTRLPVNNHRSFLFYLNIFIFWNMTSFGNIRRYLATSAGKPCFSSYVIHSGPISYVVGIDVLSRMSSSLLCIYHISLPCTCNGRLIDLRRPFSTSTTTLSNVITFFYEFRFPLITFSLVNRFTSYSHTHCW